MIIIKLLFAAAAAAILCSSCSDGLGEEIMNVTNEGEFVSVTVDVSAGDLTGMSGQAKTRSINDPAPTCNTEIKNLWVLQYNGVGDSAKLITSRYINDYATPSNRVVKLVGSTSCNTIVFLANTFDGTIGFGSDISLLKTNKFTTDGLDKVVTFDPYTVTTGATDFPNDRFYYQRLNGFDTTAVVSGDSLKAVLQHNVCRVRVNVTNNTQSTTYPVTLISADIENVPGCVYYVTDYPGYTSGSAVGKPTEDDFNHYPLKDYSDIITWTRAEGAGSAVKSATLYLPANESGVVSSISGSPQLKSKVAPARATMLLIRGSYHDSLNNSDIPITYSFALGENMTDNYQLVPNGDYQYDIVLNSRGDMAADGRVSYGSVSGEDFTNLSDWPLANCYICNPPSRDTATFKIPVARVDQFWGGGSYENVPNNCLSTGGAWTVSVIWSDMEVNSSNFILSKATGKGNSDYFEVKVPSTTVKGNVVIGIKKSGGTDFLWSWHLWVTDYCPYEAENISSQGAFLSGTDTYHVTGGEVQRYKKGATKVYMDRCIGAMDPDASGSPRGTMYYQFGRKDPFPGSSGEYYANGTAKQPYTPSTVNYTETDSYTQPQNVPYSVKNPHIFILGQYVWTYGDKYNPSTNNYYSGIIWNDPCASSNNDKSVFDPSPSGWKVPETYDGLSRNSISNGGIMCTTKEVTVQANVFLPALGARGNASPWGSVPTGCSVVNTNNVHMWCSNTINSYYAVNLYASTTGTSFYAANASPYESSAMSWRVAAKPIRPIQQ